MKILLVIFTALTLSVNAFALEGTDSIYLIGADSVLKAKTSIYLPANSYSVELVSQTDESNTRCIMKYEESNYERVIRTNRSLYIDTIEQQRNAYSFTINFKLLKNDTSLAMWCIIYNEDDNQVRVPTVQELIDTLNELFIFTPASPIEL